MRRGLENLRSNCCLIGKFVISLLLLVKIHYVQSSDNERPLLVALVDTNVPIPCTELPVLDSTNMTATKSSIRWNFRGTGINDHDITEYTSGIQFCSRCNVSVSDFNQKSNTLDTFYTIINVQLSDAGIYGCAIGGDLEKTLKEFELQVIKPECKLNVSNVTSRQQILLNEFDLVQIECNVSYWGNWQPAFKCWPETNQYSIISSSGDRKFIEYISTLNAMYELNQKTITCTMNFTSTPLSCKNVRAPDHDLVVWTSLELNVTYAVRNVSISPASDGIVVVPPGDEIHCRARGNPAPHIYWLDSNSELHYPGERYVVDWCVDNATLRSKRTVVCVAQNEINGQLHRVNKSLGVSLLAEADFLRFCHAENAAPAQNLMNLILFVTTVVLAVTVVSLSLVIIGIKGKGCCRRQVLKSNENAGQNTVQAEYLILQHQNSSSPERNVYDWLDELMDDAVPAQSGDMDYERLNIATRSPPVDYEQFKSLVLQSAGENESRES